MYNEAIKRNYIEENGLSETMLQYYFNLVAPTEDRLGKDVYDFAAQDIIDFYKLLSTSSYSVLRMCNYALKNYTTWALKKQMVGDNQNHFLEITGAILKSCVHKARLDEQIITRDELLEELKSFPNPVDAFVVLALFEGLCGSLMLELRDLTLDNISGNVISIPRFNKEVEVSDELIEYAKEAAKTFDRIPMKKDEFGDLSYDFGDPKPAYSEDDNRIVKATYNVSSVDSDRQFTRRMRSKLSKLSQITERAIYTASALIHSGRIHYIREIYDGSMPMNLFIRNHRKEIVDRYGGVAFDELYNKYKDYLES